MVAALASRILGLLDKRTPIRGQDAIGSILVDDPALSRWPGVRVT
jgi:hypothetical protein